MKVPQVAFLIGSPRSGTSWLQSMLGSHPAVVTPQELHLFCEVFADLERRWQRQLDTSSGGKRPIGLPTLMSEERFHKLMRDFLWGIYQEVLPLKPEATLILEKTPDYTLHLDLISRLVDKPIFIHLLRDGRDVAESLTQAGRSDWGASWAPRSVREAALVWKRYVKEARSACIGHECLEVRYEELLDDRAADRLAELFEFLGLEVPPDECLSILKKHEFSTLSADGRLPGLATTADLAEPDGFFRRGTAGSWSTWSDRDKWAFDQVAGDLLVELGYTQPGWTGVGPVEADFLAMKHRIAGLARRSLSRTASRTRKILKRLGIL